MTGLEMSPARASDADRDRIVRVLRDAAVDGRLSHDSFVRRVDLALRARDHRSLGGLVADLSRPGNVATRRGSGLMSLAERLRRAAGQPPPSVLALPGPADPVLLIGRRTDCDVVVDDPSVSRVHAFLMLFAGQWFVADRGSVNGTHVNGRRIWGTTTVRAGDLVRLGATTFRLVPSIADPVDQLSARRDPGSH
jgi:hypothetical protein